MAKTKTTSPKRKAVWQLTRRGLYGSIGLVLVACAWTFFLGVLVGRGTAPVQFDMEKLGQNLHALREQVQQQRSHQLEAYSAAVENKSDLDFYEDLKQSGEDLAVESEMVRRPPQPSLMEDTPNNTEATAIAGKQRIPVKKRMAGLQPKKKPAARQPPPPKGPSPQPAAAQAGGFTLQVASLRDAKTADEMVGRLRREGYSVTRTGITIPGKGTWYRVQVGRFSDRSQATKTMRALESKGLKPILVSR